VKHLDNDLDNDLDNPKFPFSGLKSLKIIPSFKTKYVKKSRKVKVIN
jgi:hypothetical protein